MHNNSKRRKRIQRMVSESMAQWRSHAPALDPTRSAENQSRIRKKRSKHTFQPEASLDLFPDSQQPVPSSIISANGQQQTDILRPIPRRASTVSLTNAVSPPMMRDLSFKVARFQVIKRLFTWLYVLFTFAGGTLWDRLRGLNSVERRAIRLRQVFERAGGTFIKFGQQMAMRIDLLPWVHTVELSKMLDQVPPFPFEQALEVINRSLDNSWQEIFAIIDPEPIGSASIACVYQAKLKNGKKVVIKVRRPGIAALFVADLKILDWLLDMAEFLTIVRPGFTQNLRHEFRRTLLEELDFVQEARFQDIFRRKAKKSGKKFFGAPRVYLELSNEEIIVEAFASGMWLWEVMAGVEQGNRQALAMMHELNISPKKVAERLLWVNYWGMQENLIFHADPHPANVIVRRNSKLNFIDFGSSGSFDPEQRDAFERISVASGDNDPEGMARASLKLLEPLPSVDLKELMQVAEADYMQVLYIFNSKRKHTHWWERTSMRQWMSFIKIAQAYNISMNLHTLRMMRATLLYDTIAVRLYQKIDRFERIRKYRKFQAKRAKKRFRKNLRKQVRRGGSDDIYLRLEELADVGAKLYYRTKDLLSSPVLNFSSLVEKWVYITTIMIRLLGRVGLVTAVAAIIIMSIQLINRQALIFSEILIKVVSNRIYMLLIAFLVFVNVRYALFRMRDPEVH